MPFRIILAFSIIILLFACKKKGGKEEVEIYTLKTYQMVAGKCQINGAASTLDDNPVVSNDDIISYSKNTYRFLLNDKAAQKVKAFAMFVPFAVTVNKQVVYYGIYKSPLSSSSCDHSITMGPDYTNQNSIQMNLGYPGLMQGVTIDDQRNNPIVLSALSAQGKLK